MVRDLYFCNNIHTAASWQTNLAANVEEFQLHEVTHTTWRNSLKTEKKRPLLTDADGTSQLRR
jgi:hypothetical protein